MSQLYEDIILYILDYLIPCQVCRSTFVENDPIHTCSVCHRSWCIPCLQDQRSVSRINRKIICKYCMHQERPIFDSTII